MLTGARPIHTRKHEPDGLSRLLSPFPSAALPFSCFQVSNAHDPFDRHFAPLGRKAIPQLLFGLGSPLPGEIRGERPLMAFQERGMKPLTYNHAAMSAFILGRRWRWRLASAPVMRGSMEADV